jgi:hypothetical protein
MLKWGEVTGFKVCAPHLLPTPEEQALFANPPAPSQPPPEKSA